MPFKGPIAKESKSKQSTRLWKGYEKIVLLIIDCLLLTLSNIILIYFLNIILFEKSQTGRHLLLNLLIIPLYFSTSFINKGFEFEIVIPLKNELIILFRSLSQTFILIFLFNFFILKYIIFSRYLVVLWFFLSFLFLLFARIGAYYYLRSCWKRGKRRKKVLAIGESSKLNQFFKILELQKLYFFDIITKIDIKNILKSGHNEVSFDKLIKILKDYSPDIVFFSLNKGYLFPLTNFPNLTRQNIEFHYILDNVIWSKNIVLNEYQGLFSLVFKKSKYEDIIKKIIKRLVDIALGSFILIFSIPIWIFYFLFIKIVSPGPVIYKMERLGQNEITFNMYKFRTMVIDADKKLKEILKNDEKLRKEFNENYKLKNDPRIIKYGNLFRKFSIDEIPQLINVLKGNLSLVGPRAIVKLELEKYKEYKKTFLSVKPGLTGLWQISGRSELSYDDRIMLDINYIENWSLWMDVEILLKTAKVILTGYGAV